MATNDSNVQTNVTHNVVPSAPDDLPPPYSAVVGNPPYGFVPPSGDVYPPTGQPPPNYFTTPKDYTPPKYFTPPGVYPHPTTVNMTQPQAGMPPPPPGMSVPVGVVVPIEVGSEPTTVTCYNCSKVVTTRINYTTAWHTHLVAGSLCVITMACSLCCLGLVPYCFDAFKDAEHYCPNCNSFIGKSHKC